MSGYPVNPIYCVEEDNTIYTLDGSQRTSTCISYINNEFALSKDIDVFVAEYADTIGTEKIDMLRTAMDKFNEVLENTKIPVTSAPMVLYSGFRVMKDKKSFSKLVETVNDFLDGYDLNEEYKQFVQSGTSGSENVKGRLDWWRNKIRTL